MEYNKIYARTDSTGKVIYIFSEVFETPRDTDILIDGTNTARHGAQKYAVTDDDGFYNYEIVNGKLQQHDKTADKIEAKKENIRQLREIKCFDYVNRGQLWYDMLTAEQKEELRLWYIAWLDAPATLVIPKTPVWLDNLTKSFSYSVKK